MHYALLLAMATTVINTYRQKDTTPVPPHLSLTLNASVASLLSEALYLPLK